MTPIPARSPTAATLFSAELRRAASRRLTRLVAVAALLGIVIAGIVVFAKSHRPGGSFAEEQRTYEQLVERCVRGDLEGFPLARPGEEGPPIDPSDRDEFCRFSGFIQPPGDPAFALTKLRDVLRGTTVPLIIAAFLLAASLIGAEWRAGTVTTALTWEPKRVRLLLTKAAAAVTVGVGLFLAVQILLSLFLSPAAVFRGTTAGADADFYRSLAGILARGSLMVAVAAAAGFSIGATGRNTAAALGIGFAYLAIVEGMLAGPIPRLRRWLVVGNSIVWVSGEEAFDIAGRSVAGAGALLAIYGTLAVAAATAIFKARDVT